MKCELSVKSGGKWVKVKTNASYRDAEEFTLKECNNIFVVKMIGDDEEIGYFTNCPDTFGKYQEKGLNCYLIGG